MHLAGCLPDAGEDGFPQPVVPFQLCDPVGHADVDLLNGEHPKQLREDGADVGFVQIRTADGDDRRIVGFPQLFRQRLRFLAVWMQTVQQDGKGLS